MSSIPTRSVWPYYDPRNVQAAAAKPKDNSLGKDDFLKILVEQLKNQNPMEPMQDRDFIAQMAQFSSVEQLMNMGKEMTALRQNLGTASGLIGKYVEWQEAAPGGIAVTYTGQVDSIGIRGGTQFVRIGPVEIPMDWISAITVNGPQQPNDGNNSQQESSEQSPTQTEEQPSNGADPG